LGGAKGIFKADDETGCGMAQHRRFWADHRQRMKITVITGKPRQKSGAHETRFAGSGCPQNDQHTRQCRFP